MNLIEISKSSNVKKKRCIITVKQSSLVNKNDVKKNSTLIDSYSSKLHHCLLMILKKKFYIIQPFPTHNLFIFHIYIEAINYPPTLTSIRITRTSYASSLNKNHIYIYICNKTVFELRNKPPSKPTFPSRSVHSSNYINIIYTKDRSTVSRSTAVNRHTRDEYLIWESLSCEPGQVAYVYARQSRIRNETACGAL